MNSRVHAAVLFLGAVSFGSVAAQEPKAKSDDKPAPKTILFLGDSITAGGGYVRAIQAELEKQSPGAWKVVNRGRNSETLSNLSEVDHPGRRPCLFARFDDVLKNDKPDLVVACYGINCGIYHPFNEKRFKAYQDGVETLVKKAHAAGARVVLLTSPPFAASGPFPEGSDEAAKEAIVAKASAAAEIEAEANPKRYGYKSPFPYYDYVMDRYAKWLLTQNGRKDVWVVDVRGAMLPKNKEAHGRDPIHPNGIGHAIMAEAFLKQWPAIQMQTK